MSVSYTGFCGFPVQPGEVVYARRFLVYIPFSGARIGWRDEKGRFLMEKGTFVRGRHRHRDIRRYLGVAEGPRS